MKLENNKATPAWKFSTQEGLAPVAALNYQMAKKQKKKQTGLSATYYSPISSSITTFS